MDEIEGGSNSMVFVVVAVVWGSDTTCLVVVSKALRGGEIG